MKKILSTVLALALVLCMVLSLASCSKMLMGKYTCSVLGVETSYEFSGNKVTKTTGLGSSKITTEGTYEIKTADDGSMTITFTWGEGEAETDVAFSEGEENGVKYIKIGIVKFTKE